VEATAQLIYTGHSSMHILVIVRSGSVQDRLLTEATQCLMSSSPWAPTVVQVR
jgi:acyl-CoA hydrolase